MNVVTSCCTDCLSISQEIPQGAKRLQEALLFLYPRLGAFLCLGPWVLAELPPLSRKAGYGATPHNWLICLSAGEANERART